MIDPGPVVPTRWQTAVVREVTHPNPNGVRIRLEAFHRQPHLPGQHYVVRLTAPDGYRAQRSYSLSSAPQDELLELWVERIPGGEVSAFLAEVVAPGDELEVRGPMGGWFVWDAAGPALGIAGGSGVVPLVAMSRYATLLRRGQLLRCAVSARTWAELPYGDVLSSAGALVALTREPSPAGRPPARLRPEELAPLLLAGQTCFVCGSPGFTGAATDLLMGLGVAADRIRVETFGPSG